MLKWSPIVLSWSLTLTACGEGSSPTTMGEDEPDPTGGPIANVPAGPVEERALLTVPFDDDDVSGETIELAYIRIQQSDDAEPILVHFGGPGTSAVALLPGFVRRLPDEFRERYAFIGLDEIGVGASPVLNCFNFPVSDTLVAPFVVASEVELEQFGQDYAEACRGSPIFNETGTARYARDIDRLREELGYERLNILGFSYGNEVALHYAALFPDRIGRMVLDSPVDTRVRFVDTFVLQGQALAEAFDGFLAWCDEQDTCTVDLIGLNRLIDSLSVVTDPGSTELAERLLNVILRDLRFEPNWPSLAITLEEFIDRPELLVARAGRQAEASMLDAFVATSCTDLPIDSTAEIFDATAQFRRDYQSQLSLNFFAPQFDLAFPCVFWDADAEPIAWDSVLPELQNGDSILILSASGDTQTPRAFSDGLLDAIPELRMVSVDEVSHAISFIGLNPCLTNAAIEFFNEGTVSVTECEKSAPRFAGFAERGVLDQVFSLHEPFPLELLRVRR